MDSLLEPGTQYEVGSIKADAGSSKPTRIRRRNRMITSCLECRRRKLRCDRLHPCSNCSKGERDCVFLAPALGAAARLKLMELKDKMGSLERSLEQDVAEKQQAQSTEELKEYSPSLFSDATEPESSQLPIPDDEKDLEPSRMAVQDAAYEDEADDDVYDLGFRLGKLTVTERIGGFFRPRIADEVSGSKRCWKPSSLPVRCDRGSILLRESYYY
jgi:Fungal Zn(2)-Cys(6) binuclear cluster domain